MGGSEEELEDFDEDGEDEEGYDRSIGDLPPQPIMKKELTQAILDEIEDFTELKKRNEEF